MTTTNFILLLGSLLIVGGIIGVLEHRAIAKLREGNRALRQDAEQLARASAEYWRLSNLLVRASSPALTEAQMRELLRLRGEVGVLRQQTKELAKLHTEKNRWRSRTNPPARDSSQPSSV